MDTRFFFSLIAVPMFLKQLYILNLIFHVLYPQGPHHILKTPFPSLKTKQNKKNFKIKFMWSESRSFVRQMNTCESPFLDKSENISRLFFLMCFLLFAPALWVPTSIHTPSEELSAKQLVS